MSTHLKKANIVNNEEHSIFIDFNPKLLKMSKISYTLATSFKICIATHFMGGIDKKYSSTPNIIFILLRIELTSHVLYSKDTNKF